MISSISSLMPEISGFSGTSLLSISFKGIPFASILDSNSSKVSFIFSILSFNSSAESTKAEIDSRNYWSPDAALLLIGLNKESFSCNSCMDADYFFDVVINLVVCCRALPLSYSHSSIKSFLLWYFWVNSSMISVSTSSFNLESIS